MSREPILYLQTDSKWSDKDYSAPGEKTTIGRAGCGVTCAAMVIASLMDPSITPADTSAWSLKHGYKALRQGTYYSYFVPQLKRYGINCKQVNASNMYEKNAESNYKKIIQALQSGKWIIACMGKGIWTSSGHYVLAWKTDGKRVYIKDPASQKSMRMCNDLQLWLSQIKYAWIIDFEAPEGEKDKRDDEVIEKKKIAIMGHDVEVENIFKDGRNFSSIRDVCKALGCKVISAGREPIISANTIKMNVGGQDKTVSGFNAGGTVYVAVRPFAESLGKSVGWDSEENRVVIE